MVYSWHPSTQAAAGRWVSVFKASLVYTARPRLTAATATKPTTLAAGTQSAAQLRLVPQSGCGGFELHVFTFVFPVSPSFPPLSREEGSGSPSLWASSKLEPFWGWCPSPASRRLQSQGVELPSCTLKVLSVGEITFHFVGVTNSLSAELEIRREIGPISFFILKLHLFICVGGAHSQTHHKHTHTINNRKLIYVYMNSDPPQLPHGLLTDWCV